MESAIGSSSGIEQVVSEARQHIVVIVTPYSKTCNTTIRSHPTEQLHFLRFLVEKDGVFVEVGSFFIKLYLKPSLVA